MRRPNFPAIKGFELYPEGRLLAQVVDFDRPFGIAYERCIGYQKPRHSHDRYTITFPRGSSRSEMEVLSEKRLYRLDSASVHLMPTGLEHEQRTLSAVYDTFALFVGDEVLERIFLELELTGEVAKGLLTVSRRIRRARLLDEAVDRYFFLRVVAPGTSPEEAAYLESFILRHLFMTAAQGKCHKVAPAPATTEGAGTAVSRALEYIESHLFEKLEARAIVAYARASQATLFRQFRKEVRLSPIEYVRQRRLDEAASLLGTGQYQVSDVALLVGYEDLSAFSKAFKRRFGKSPSRLIPT